ncbi:MAG: hypothetical protein ACTHKJ_00670 [Candidatus Nitrosocosmicus sp.]
MKNQSSCKSSIFSLMFYFILIIGVSLQFGGSNWDVVWHGSKKVESFLTPPHAVIYSGVAIIIGNIIFKLFLSGAFKKKLTKHIISFSDILRNVSLLPFPLKLCIIGSLLQITAGPFDFWWHTKFGFDGLLSPPHFVLAMGMFLISLGAMIGVYKNIKVYPFSNIGGIFFLISCGVCLIVLIGIILLFTLPFSKGQYFDFNPDPFSALFEAIIFMPFIMSVFLSIICSVLKTPYTFTLIFAVIIAIQSLSTIVSNSYFIGTFPYYILNSVPPIFVDLIVLKYNINIYNNNNNNLNKNRHLSISLFKNRYFIASTSLSMFFIPLFFPWTGDVFWGFFKPSNELRMEDFLFQILVPIILPVIIPISFVSSIIGSFIAEKFIKQANINNVHRAFLKE